MTDASTSRVVACPHCKTKNRVPATGNGKPSCGKCHRPLPWIADASDATFADIAEQTDMYVLVDLWAPWCGPCRMVSPALETVAEQMAGQLKLVKVEVDSNPQLSSRYEVQAVPTLLVLKNGRVVARQAGAAPAPALRTWAEEAIARDQADSAAGTGEKEST